MKPLNLFHAAILGLTAFAVTGATVQAQLRVVATTPDLASLAREIGGRSVTVTALSKPTEDPHFVDAKPSHIVTLNRADALIEGGAELEIGWLPPLMDNSRNPRIAASAPGRIVASQGVRMLDVPAAFDRSKGDVHAMGNPHFLIDPLNAKIVARNIAERFGQIDPRSAAAYRANLAAFNSKLDSKLAGWQSQLAPYRARPIVTYHKDFVYFASRFGLNVVQTLEPKPGIAPSPSHLAMVIGRMRATKTKVVLVQPYQNRRTAETVARQTSAAVVGVTQQPGGRGNGTTYFDMMDAIVSALASAFRAQN